MMVRTIIKDGEVNVLKTLKEDAFTVSGPELLNKLTPEIGFGSINKDSSIRVDVLDERMGRLNESDLSKAVPSWLKVNINLPFHEFTSKGLKTAILDAFQKILPNPGFESELMNLKFLSDQPHEARGHNYSDKHQKEQDDFILVKTDYKMVKLRIMDILYLEGKGNYVSIFTRNAKILVHQTMKKLEANLLPYQFLRIHKSFIVSFKHIDAFDKNSVTINGTDIPISEFYKDNFMHFLERNARQI